MNKKDGSVLILCYHSIGNNLQHKLGVDRISKENFIKQLVFLKQNYEIISLSEINQVSTNYRVVLTFDDGYLDNYLDVANILVDKNIPGTFFISPFFIEHSFYFYTDVIAYLIDLNLYEEFLDKYYLKKWHFNHIQDEITEISLKSNQFIMDFIININNFIQSNSITNLPSPMNINQIYKLNEERLFALGHHTYLHSRYNRNRSSDFLSDIQNGLNFFSMREIPTVPFFPYPFGHFDSFSDDFSSIIEKKYKIKSLSTIPTVFNTLKDFQTIPRLSVQNWTLPYFKFLINSFFALNHFRHTLYNLNKFRFNMKVS